MTKLLATDAVLGALKAAAEPTRLRILLLLANGELNVKDITQILGQSQPRISRHLKLLSEAGLIERFREGSWVYFHLPDDSGGGRLARFILDAIDLKDPQLVRDRARAMTLKQEREIVAQDYFDTHAAEWDAIRSHFVADAQVETAMEEMLGSGPFDLFVDLGTGNGRMLELFAPRYERGLGLDLNHSMLTHARANLERSGLTNCRVRHGDLYNLALADDVAGAVIMHQVLHFLSDPARAIEEAARVLAPGGQILIVDYAPHDLEIMHTEFAHERLGFAKPQIENWMSQAGLIQVGSANVNAPPPGKPATPAQPPLQAKTSKTPAGAQLNKTASSPVKPSSSGKPATSTGPAPQLPVLIWLGAKPSATRRQGQGKASQSATLESTS